VAAGHEVVVHNRSRGPAEDLVAAGARRADSAADTARRSTIVITMLPDGPDVELVIAGEDGVLAGLQPGSIVIDMSSISPATTSRLAALVAGQGSAMLDAPVSGGEAGAIGGTLSVMVGGDDKAFARAQPVLACMGSPERIVHVGVAPGSGQVCKICNQIAIGGALAGVSEAFAVARKAGVDVSKVRSALLGGFAASRVLEVHGERMITGNWKPGFKAKFFKKDLGIALNTLAENGVSAPTSALVQQLVHAQVGKSGGDEDYSAIATVIFEMAGLG
jgi:2-hydroxy-3-oxopropionate reductase